MTTLSIVYTTRTNKTGIDNIISILELKEEIECYLIKSGRDLQIGVKDKDYNTASYVVTDILNDKY